MAFQITASLFRILIAVSIFLLGFKTCDIVNRPLPLTNDLSTLLSNQTLSLEFPGHSDTVIATAYIPTSLYDHGRISVFWCALLALACAGSYFVDKVQHHFISHLATLHSEAGRVSGSNKIRFYVHGVRSISLTAWVNVTGSRDTYRAWVHSVPAVIGVLYPIIVTGIQNLASDNVTDRLQHLPTTGAANNTVFGNSIADGTYTLERWTCQIAPLVSSSANITTSTRTRQILSQSCHDGQTSRFLLLIMLPFTILMLLSIAKPHWFTFTFGAEKTLAWTSVPLEENDKDLDSDDDDTPLGAYRKVLDSRVRSATTFNW